MKKGGFKVISVVTHQVMYPLMDLVVRLFIKFRLVEPNVRFYEPHKILGVLRKFKLPIFGYKNIEVLVKKIE